MGLLMVRGRHFFEQTGHEYPPSHWIIAEFGYLSVVLFAAAQRFWSGSPGADAVLVIAGLTVGAAPLVLSICIECRPHLWLLPTVTAAALALFWLVPTVNDVAPLLLTVAAVMSSAVSSFRLAVVWTVVYMGLAVVGHVIADASLLAVCMVGFGGVTGQVMQKQLRISEIERRDRDRQLALDRAEIAGEVHDVVAHSLSIVLLNVTAARRALQCRNDGAGSSATADVDADVADAVAALEDAERQGRCAMNDVRRTIELLRADVATDAAQPGLDDLPELVDGFRNAGADVTFRFHPPTGRLSSATELAVYRVVQESLSNAVKHASGMPVDVEVRPQGKGVVIRICNSIPTGGTTAVGGLGLPGMAARVENVDGTLKIGDDNGTWSVEAEFGGHDHHGADAESVRVSGEGCLMKGMSTQWGVPGAR